MKLKNWFKSIPTHMVSLVSYPFFILLTVARDRLPPTHVSCLENPHIFQQYIDQLAWILIFPFWLPVKAVDRVQEEPAFIRLFLHNERSLLQKLIRTLNINWSLYYLYIKLKLYKLMNISINYHFAILLILQSSSPQGII